MVSAENSVICIERNAIPARENKQNFSVKQEDLEAGDWAIVEDPRNGQNKTVDMLSKNYRLMAHGGAAKAPVTIWGAGTTLLAPQSPVWRGSVGLPGSTQSHNIFDEPLRISSCCKSIPGNPNVLATPDRETSPVYPLGVSASSVAEGVYTGIPRKSSRWGLRRADLGKVDSVPFGWTHETLCSKHDFVICHKQHQRQKQKRGRDGEAVV